MVKERYIQRLREIPETGQIELATSSSPTQKPEQFAPGVFREFSLGNNGKVILTANGAQLFHKNPAILSHLADYKKDKKAAIRKGEIMERPDLLALTANREEQAKQTPKLLTLLTRTIINALPKKDQGNKTRVLFGRPGGEGAVFSIKGASDVLIKERDQAIFVRNPEDVALGWQAIEMIYNKYMSPEDKQFLKIPKLFGVVYYERDGKTEDYYLIEKINNAAGVLVDLIRKGNFTPQESSQILTKYKDAMLRFRSLLTEHLGENLKFLNLLPDHDIDNHHAGRNALFVPKPGQVPPYTIYLLEPAG